MHREEKERERERKIVLSRVCSGQIRTSVGVKQFVERRSSAKLNELFVLSFRLQWEVMPKMLQHCPPLPLATTDCTVDKEEGKNGLPCQN